MLEIHFYRPIQGLESARHLVYYIPTHLEDTSNISRLVLNFKDNKPQAVKFWSDLLVNELQKEAGNYSAIIRPLSSKETDEIIPGALDTLGQTLSDALHTPYIGQFFVKDEIRKALHFIPSATERYQTLADNYNLKYRLKPDKVGKARLLLIDDVATTGATAKTICELFSKSYPDCQLNLVTIARTQNSKDANQGFSDIISQISNLKVIS